MDSEFNLKLEELFNAALERDPRERASFIKQVSAGDDQLRTSIESLLAADSDAQAFLETPAPLLTGVAGHELGGETSTLVGRKIGSYELIRLMGHGGMGSVYEARQQDPARTVALKLLKPGAASRSAQQRFRHEATILGHLHHSGIAQIYEAGTAIVDDRQIPFFAMELVEGNSLRNYVEANRLSVPARLELMAKICDAVQHAHQKGIIHRDLKPANIIVDAVGHPKILDFGVARLSDSDVQLTTAQTDIGVLIGTLPYMSPEQVAADPEEIDTRCDVYALGVILYQVLAGHLPFDLGLKSIPEAVRTIRDVDAPRIGSIANVFRGDIDTIICKALAKDRAQRYQSASELAADIRRFLGDQPISARPPSVTYHLRKFARRNRAVVAGIVVAVVGMAAGLGGAIWQALEATSQRDRAIAEARKAERINVVLQTIFAVSDPATADHDMTVREALDRAVVAVETELAGEPEVRAAASNKLGQIYARLGRFDEAERLHRSAIEERKRLFGDESIEVARTITDLAWVVLDRGDFEQGERLFAQVLIMMRKLRGDNHPETAMAKVCLASAKNELGQFATAETILREALPQLIKLHGQQHEDTAFAQQTLADSVASQGKHKDAEQLYRLALATQRELLGSDHIQVAITLTHLAQSLKADNRGKEAAPLFDEAAAIRRRRYGSQ